VPPYPQGVDLLILRPQYVSGFGWVEKVEMYRARVYSLVGVSYEIGMSTHRIKFGRDSTTRLRSFLKFLEPT
jgi:hypothetical protein